MKENLEFYQHFTGADQHPKFKMLRVKYGWEGEGKFWALNNRIGLAQYCLLNLNDSDLILKLLGVLDLTEKELNNFINWLVFECELLHFHGHYLTSKNLQQQMLRIHKAYNIRLSNTNVNKWYRIIKAVFKRDNYICQYCGKIGGKLECDHKIPISRGGTNDYKNLTTACQRCNRQKRDKTPEEYKQWLGLRGEN